MKEPMVPRVPDNLLEFQEMFATEEACRKYLLSLRWPEGFVCPRCGGREAYDLPKRRLYQCKSCAYQVSPTAGTVMHRTRLPLLKWFWAIYLVGRSKRGISALELSRQIHVRYKAAWLMLHKLRSTLTDEGGPPLSGRIEVDEAYAGNKRRTLKRGRMQSVVAVAVESRGDWAGRGLLLCVPDRSRESLEGFIGKNAATGSHMITDGLPSYWDLPALGYTHEAISWDEAEDPSSFLSWAHVLITNLKTWILGTHHGVSTKHLPRYLQEFTYRLNRRRDEPSIFARILRRAMFNGPITYRLLVSESQG